MYETMEYIVSSQNLQKSAKKTRDILDEITFHTKKNLQKSQFDGPTMHCLPLIEVIVQPPKDTFENSIFFQI